MHAPPPIVADKESFASVRRLGSEFSGCEHADLMLEVEWVAFLDSQALHCACVGAPILSLTLDSNTTSDARNQHGLAIPTELAFDVGVSGGGRKCYVRSSETKAKEDGPTFLAHSSWR